MRNSHHCPKCGSTELFRINGEIGPYGSGNNIRLGLLYSSSIPVTRYICCGCGFTEEWIDPEYLQKLCTSKKAIHL